MVVDVEVLPEDYCHAHQHADFLAAAVMALKCLSQPIIDNSERQSNASRKCCTRNKVCVIEN